MFGRHSSMGAPLRLPGLRSARRGARVHSESALPDAFRGWCVAGGVSLAACPGAALQRARRPHPPRPVPCGAGARGRTGNLCLRHKRVLRNKRPSPWLGTRAEAIYRLKMDSRPASPPALAGASGSSALLPASFSATWRNPLPAGLLTDTGLPSTRARCRSSGA